MRISLSELANKLNVPFEGDGDCLIENISRLQDAKPGDLSFITTEAFAKYLPFTEASVVILHPTQADQCKTNKIIDENPYLVYAKAAAFFDRPRHDEVGVHPSAVIHETAVIGDNVSIGPQVIIGRDVKIEQGVVIEAGSYVGPHCKIGKNSRLMPNVTLVEDVFMGERNIIHSHAVIGADGFGNVLDKDHWVKIPQLGGVVIGNDVEIGANTTIDKGSVGDTLIGNGVRIDNLVQIAHNVSIGDHTVIAGCAGVAGSTTIGRYCMIGGGSGITGHIELCDRVHIGGMSSISRSILQPGAYVARGYGVQTLEAWTKTVAKVRRMIKVFGESSKK